MSENNPLKSDYEPVIWSNNGVDGKVRIIDPNPLAQIVPHEDLFIYVSLKANQRSKTLLTQSDNNGGIKIENFIRNTIDLTVPQQTTEMVDGSKLFSNVAALSTEWTEIGGSPFKENDLGKDFEGFGITNIDIEVKSQTNPKVIIDFIDVRGATLMEQGSCSPYGLFFNLPYPVFTLTLKGYYGRPATYYLNLVKFNSKFNSDTGNIECRGEFIGWTFGFLSDVMVSYASAAQYLNEGLYRPQAILKQKYEDTWNYYIDSGFIPEGTPQPYCSVQNPDGTTRCKTIKDLLTDNYILQHTTLPDVKGSTEFIELDNVLKLEQNCLQYQEKLNDLEKELGNLLKDQTTSSNPNYTSKFKIPNLKSSDVVKTPNQTAGTEGNKFSKTNNNTVNSVKELLNRYFDKKGGFLTNNIIIIKNLQITEGVKGFEFISGYNNALLTSANAEELNADGGSTKYIYDILNKDSYVKKFQNGFLDDFGYLGGGTSDDSDFWIDLGVLKEGIDNDLKTVRAEIDKRREETINIINDKIRTVIGFDPTIRNIFTVILCNSDTFMEILKEVSVKAEDYHDKNKITDGSILSGPNNKIFAWPTYMQSKTIGGKQSTARKEVYPGVTYPQWPEVKFVEDFINAFLDFKKDIDLLNDDKQGKPGFDDYAPINPLETPLNRDDYFLIYKDIQNNAEIGNGTGFYRAIGERLFVALDHSYLQPLRSDGITKFIPETTVEGLPNTPLNDADRIEFIQSLGSIDAWNLVNTIENPDLGYSIINGSISSEDFINKVTEQLNQVGVLTKVNEQTGNLLSRNESYGPFALNELKGDYFMYKPNEKEGCGHCIKLNGSGILGGDPIFIHPNPHKMDVSNLIQFRDGNEQPRAIELTIEDFKTKVKSYTGILQKSVPSTYDADEWEFAGDLQQINEVTIDEETKQQTPKYASNRLLFTLDLLNIAGGWLDNGNNLSSWFKNDNTTEIPTNVMGSYMIHDYWSDEVDIYYYDKGDDTAWVFLNTPYETNGEFTPVLENDDKENPNIRLSILPITTTPLWLDNVNNFRKESYKTISGGNDLKTFGLKRSNGVAYNTKDIEARNLAYLFLQTLKPTPLIVRLTDDDTEMQETTSFTKQYSVKLFNSGAGIVKVPKAWVYSMGAILWRWKCFVANPSTNEWTNPIKKQKPLGYDPLSQPGFGGTTERDEHQYSGEDSSQEYNRSRIDDYLKHVYGNPPSGSNWGSRVQESVFNKQNFDVYNCVAFDSSQNQIGAEGWGFDYYNIYQAGSFTNRVTTNTQQPTGINTETVKKWTENYGWPQAWISPHHIPYTHPVCLDDTRGDEDESDFTWFTVISSNASAYNDYHSIQNYAFGVDGEFTLGGVSSVSRDFELNTGGRSVKHDGALGHVLQNLPDQVKDEFIRIFEEWVDNEWKDELLPIVDPANFGTTTSTMTQVYQTYKDVPIEDSSVLFGFKDEGAPKETLKKKLLVDTFSIINSTPKIWWGVDYDSFRQGTNVPSGAPGFIDDNFIVKEDDYRIYLNAFYEEFKIALEKRIKKLQEDESKENEAVGETLLEDDDVKLSLYRTFKSMADKWFSTDPSGKLFFNVTEGANSTYCNKSSGVETVGKNGKSTLATHFQYVSRTMVDIGNDAVIDITKLNELKDNLKISLYQYLSDVLTENNYLFFPLPSYINFGTNGMKTEDLLDMFRPTMSMKDVSCGPLFLSMYVGGNSRVLNINNFGAKVNCPIDFNALSDDGFDLSTGRNTPDEFKQPAPSDPGVTAFRIVYGLENQNHFKNIQLDQSEFSETSESLLVIDKLAQQGGSDQASKGQNLHNVYLTRSYTCQVESFGNVMIQPMTYFDLFGVPMFNGTYLITEVRHNFKPNHATTTFKGVRQPIATVPIITKAALAMDLSLKDVKASENRKSIQDASTAGRTSVSRTTEIYSNNEFTQVVVKDEPVKTPPTLNEILNVMRTKKGVFYSNKASGFSGKKMKDTKTQLIEKGIYDPKKSYIIYTDPYVVNIVGVRNFVQTPGSFDDYLAVFYKDPSCSSCKDGWQFKIWPITTDPGITGQQMVTTNDTLGAGFIAEGQFIGSHLSGQHRNEYSALHNTRPILVYRDPGDIWVEKDTNSLYVDTPGMNIHASGSYEKSGTKVNEVSNWSAGCQVFKSPRDYMEFLDIIFTKAKNPEVGKSTSIKIDNGAGCSKCGPLSAFLPNGSTLKNGQSYPIREFTYTLLNTAEFGKPANITIGDTIYENFIPGGARAGTTNTGNSDIVKYNTIPSTPQETKKYYETILTKLGAPITEGNLLFLRGWRQAEGGSATWNGFNTTLKSEGSTNYDSVPVQNYQTLEQGAQAIVDTLLKTGNGSYYANIVSSLKKGIKDQKEAEKIALDLQQKGKDLFCWVKGCKGKGDAVEGYLAKVLKYNVGEGNVPKIV